MMKTRRLAWTSTATSTPPAWSKAFGKLSNPAPKAAFTIRKMVAIVEVPPCWKRDWYKSLNQKDFSYHAIPRLSRAN